MLDFNKRRILDICKECVSDLDIDENLDVKNNDITTDMYLIGADISIEPHSDISLIRYERYR